MQPLAAGRTSGPPRIAASTGTGLTRRALGAQRVRIEALHRPIDSLPQPLFSPSLHPSGLEVSGQRVPCLSPDVLQRQAPEARVPMTSLYLLPGCALKIFNDPLPRGSAKMGARPYGELAWLKRVTAKRARTLRRLHQCEDRLIAYKGERGVIATIVMGRSQPNYERRVDMLWAFMARIRLNKQPRTRFDEPMSDYSDHAYLVGETCEQRDKSKAAFAALCPTLMSPGPSQDTGLKLRRRKEVRERSHSRVLPAVCNYENDGRVQKLAEQVVPTIMRWGEEVREQFHSQFRAGSQQAPTGDGIVKQEAFTGYHS